jgi:cell division septum initiation protein DivIVA
MSDFDRRGLPVAGAPKRRSTSSRFADLGDRLARTFSTVDRVPDEPPRWVMGSEVDYEDSADTIAWSPNAERFPVVQHGYDPTAVEEEIAALERELGELRASRGRSTSVEEELDRIGEQTASILRTAYEQAHEITRNARVQADKCVADAAANAVAITEDANRRLREVDVETESVWQERARLIEDARGVATELLSLADTASERFSEGAKPGPTGSNVALAEPPPMVEPAPGADSEAESEPNHPE